MSDLVKRLRHMDRGWPTILSTAADRIEQLERENRELKMQALSDSAQYQMLAEELAKWRPLHPNPADARYWEGRYRDAEEELAAEKALATRLAAQLFSYMTTEYWSDGDEEVIAAYRKARGL